MNLITGPGLMIFFGLIVAGGIVAPILLFLMAHFMLIAGLVLVPLLMWRAVKLEQADRKARYIRTGR
jgi:hypothetical protein